MAKMENGKTISFKDQQEIAWKHAKRLMRLKDGATPEDLEYALAVMIKDWDLTDEDGNKLPLPRVDKDGITTFSGGLDELTAGQINEIAGLIAESNNASVGK